MLVDTRYLGKYGDPVKYQAPPRPRPEGAPAWLAGWLAGWLAFSVALAAGAAPLSLLASECEVDMRRPCGAAAQGPRIGRHACARTSSLPSTTPRHARC
eukprot:COSAG01_NODE_1513_length_10065_cov_63.160144_15_plen_99_part_00